MKKLLFFTGAAIAAGIYFLLAQPQPTLTRGGGSVEGGTITNVTIVSNSVSYLTVVTQTVQHLTALNSYISNLFVQNGKNNTLIITQYVRMPWTTLSMSGSNVSTIDLASASVFKLTLTNDAFINAPSGLPGTNDAQIIQLHLKQDGTGVRTVTMTNASWVVAGSGESTNAVISVTTNANAITVLTFVTSPFSATKLYGVPAPMIP